MHAGFSTHNPILQSNGWAQCYAISEAMAATYATHLRSLLTLPSLTPFCAAVSTVNLAPHIFQWCQQRPDAEAKPIFSNCEGSNPYDSKKVQFQREVG
jgi:hypothetical protein